MGREREREEGENRNALRPVTRWEKVVVRRRRRGGSADRNSTLQYVIRPRASVVYSTLVSGEDVTASETDIRCS